ncbi:DUF6517 family protein [Natrinema sp. 1APR25-10V2]|uniref:DUF6517 family protein n=1 Tax=Natrinema sp. 1APR25-10V2 TaxID=2951081 RepID=UPI002876862F|nr:DUF6517 family protein [Natrinema sp. 1APR25-10V2]MDS0477853.1 DUF6517 family protein [Natrinema sp. 1APR25-10V2]
MTYSRRSVLAAGATGSLALTAGCLDFVLGNGPLKFDSDRAAPTDGALEETGYQKQEVREEKLERTVELPGGVERDVSASIWASAYTKKVEYAGQKREGAAFAAVSVPGMEVAGKSVNPIDDMSNKELLDRFMSQIESEQGAIEDIEHEESFPLGVLGDERTVDTFIGKSELEGQTIDIEIKLTSFDHDGDLLVLIGLYPKMLTEESANAEVLMESVQHPYEG